MSMSRSSLVVPETRHRSEPEAAIVDCTALPRFGLRGRGSCLWLKSQGFAVPDALNRAAVARDGTLMLRLGQDEALIAGAGNTTVTDTEARWAAATGARGYDAFRRDGWAHLVIIGPGTSELMSEITEIDLRPSSMPVDQIAQTRALHLDAVIVRTDRFSGDAYEIFFDIASRDYAIHALEKGRYEHAFLSQEEFLARRQAAAGWTN